MIDLVTAVRQSLASRSELTDLLGHDDIWDTYIFQWKNYVMIENTGAAMIVVSQEGAWASPNQHNTAKFPRIIVDVWVDSMRAPDNSILIEDARPRITQIFAEVDRVLHVMSADRPDGGGLQFGSPEEITAGQGLHIISSKSLSGAPMMFPIGNLDGGWMGTQYYGVSL